jgi:hypothetical protein
MTLTNNQLLNLQQGIGALAGMGMIKLSAKAHYAIMKNKPHVTTALKPFVEMSTKLWQDSGAVIAKVNGRDEWTYKDATPEEIKEKGSVVIKQIESLLTEKCEADVHQVPFADFNVEENKIPFTLTELLEPMIVFED